MHMHIYIYVHVRIHIRTCTYIYICMCTPYTPHLLHIIKMVSGKERSYVILYDSSLYFFVEMGFANGRT